MKMAVSIPPFAAPEVLLELAVTAEQTGWDGVFFWDHLVWLPQMRVDIHDPWVLLGAVAARTERVKLGTMITPLARRRPWVVARHLITLDHLTGGRVIFGVGLGVPAETEFAAFGEPADARVRAARLDEGLAVLNGLLRGPLDHQGDHYQVQADLRPRPVQQPRPPIWVAGVAPHRRPLLRATRWDGVVPLGPDAVLTPAELADYLAAVERPATWDVVAARSPDAGPQEYAEAGATWLVEGVWPAEDWQADLRDVIQSGPPR